MKMKNALMFSGLAAFGFLAGNLAAADVEWNWNNAEGGDFAVRENWLALNAVAQKAPGAGTYWKNLKEGRYTVNFTQDYTLANGNALRRFYLQNTATGETDVTLDLGGHTVEMNSFLAGKHPKHAAAETDPDTGLRDPGFRITITNGNLKCFTLEGETETLCKGLFALGGANGLRYCGHLTLSGPDTEVTADTFRFNGGTNGWTVGNSLSIINGAKLYASKVDENNGNKSDLLVSGAGSVFDIGANSSINVRPCSEWKFADGAQFRLKMFGVGGHTGMTFDNVSTVQPVEIRQTSSNKDPARLEIVNNSEIEFSANLPTHGTNCFVRVSDSTVNKMTIWAQAANGTFVMHNAKAIGKPSFQFGTDGNLEAVRTGAAGNVLKISGKNTRLDLGNLRLAVGAKVQFEVGGDGFAEIPMMVNGEFHSVNQWGTNTIELVVDEFCKKQPLQSAELMWWARIRSDTIDGITYSGFYTLTNEVYITRKGQRKRASEIEGVDPFFGSVELRMNFSKGTLVYVAPPPPPPGLVIFVK